MNCKSVVPFLPTELMTQNSRKPRPPKRSCQNGDKRSPGFTNLAIKVGRPICSRSEVIQMQGVASPRDRESRSTRRIEAFVHRQNGREIGAFVTNVSNCGCQLKPRESLEIDEFVRIEIPRVGSVAARIRWTSNGNSGAEFIPQSDIWEEVPGLEG